MRANVAAVCLDSVFRLEMVYHSITGMLGAGVLGERPRLLATWQISSSSGVRRHT